MLEYLDTVLGRLFNYLESSPHRQKTYIMISGDNGPDMRMEEILHGKEVSRVHYQQNLETLPTVHSTA